MAEINKKIVIFDDDEDILLICTSILEEEGWKVYVFSDCINLIENLTVVNPDVILMDNWIPDKGGIVATQLIKATKTLKRIPVVYFSANNGIASLAATAGADMFISKPFDLDFLKKTLAKALTIKRDI